MKLVISLLITLGVGAIAGYATATNINTCVSTFAKAIFQSTELDICASMDIALYFDGDFVISRLETARIAREKQSPIILFHSAFPKFLLEFYLL